ncbi:hypothetical protein Halar_0010 (plasmid) [halophilic archaeon DL31]|jgi:hypothetical protein|nr:hypothetical protein Halar_0010 [halophilic archaeon DL31]
MHVNHDPTTGRSNEQADAPTKRGGETPDPEPSPSAGWRETAALMHVAAGLEECDVLECGRDAEPVRVVDDAADTVREGVRCSDHAKDFLEVSS